MANESVKRRKNNTGIKSSDMSRANRLMTAALSRAGAKKQDADEIKKTVWELRSIMSRDRNAGHMKAAMSIAKDIGPANAIAAMSRLEDMGMIDESEVTSIVDAIKKKYQTPDSEIARITRLFNQAANAISDSGIGLIGPKVINGRTIGSGNAARNRNPVIGSDENTGKTVEKSGASVARDYYSSIGLNSDVPDEMMPVSGYVVHGDHIKKKKQAVIASGVGNSEPDSVFEVGDTDEFGDGLTAHGEIEIILKPAVSGRTAYGMGSGMKNGNKPVKLNSTNKEDVADALANLEGLNGKTESMEAMLNLLASSIDDNFSDVNSSLDENGSMRRTGQFDSSKRSRNPLEAHVLGGFDIDEIEQVNYPFTKMQKIAVNEDISDVVNDSFIRMVLAKGGLNKEELEYVESAGILSQTNTESMQMLRTYRLADKMKKRYEESGINKFQVAHPSGINIFNPLSHSKIARPGQDVESVLVENIENEIREMGQRLLKDMRKGEKPSLISRRGGKI